MDSPLKGKPQNKVTKARGKEKENESETAPGWEGKNCCSDLLHVPDENLASNSVSLPHAPIHLVITNMLVPKITRQLYQQSHQLQALTSLNHPASGSLVLHGHDPISTLG